MPPLLHRTQEEICLKYQVEVFPAPSHLKLGISQNVRNGIYPINGLRIPPEGDTTGWYLWTGETLSTDPHFFAPLHVAHLEEWCPSVLPFLGLPPGWRFQIAPGYEDVWFDATLLHSSV